MTSRRVFYDDEKCFNRGGVQAASSFQPFHKTFCAFDCQADIGLALSSRNPLNMSGELAVE